MAGRDPGLVGMRDGAVVAQGELARALDTQLASTQPADAAARIGISFRNRDGGYCRTFQVTGLDGLACRSEDRWVLRGMVSADAKPASEYRQASSADPAILTAAQARMAGHPLDGAAERLARDGNWR